MRVAHLVLIIQGTRTLHQTSTIETPLMRDRHKRIHSPYTLYNHGEFYLTCHVMLFIVIPFIVIPLIVIPWMVEVWHTRAFRSVVGPACFCATGIRQLVYGHLVYDNWSTDIWSTDIKFWATMTLLAEIEAGQMQEIPPNYKWDWWK